MYIKFIKSALIPLVIKIAKRMQKNEIFGYMIEKICESALVPLFTKISIHLQENIIFRYIYEKITKSALVPPIKTFPETTLIAWETFQRLY